MNARCFFDFQRTTAALFVLALAACSNPMAPTMSSILAISDIAVPATVSPGALIPIDAIIEYGGCDAFTKLSVERSANQILVTAVGEQPTGPNIVCPSILRKAKAHVEIQAPVVAGPVTITASEPAGAAAVVRQLQVVPFTTYL